MVAGIAGALSLVGTLASVAGSVVGFIGAQRAEAARRQQMQLEAARARREQIRKAQVARATATASAENQGALQSSALAGGIAQTSNEAGRNLSAITQDQVLGNKIFAANRLQAIGGLIGSLGSGLGSLGGAFASNAGTLTRVGFG